MSERDDTASRDELHTVLDVVDREDSSTWSASPTVAVVDAVSEAIGREPTDVSPLQHSVDAEALDALLDGDGRGTDVHVEFLYEGTRVTVDSAGNVDVLPENERRG